MKSIHIILAILCILLYTLPGAATAQSTDLSWTNEDNVWGYEFSVTERVELRIDRDSACLNSKCYVLKPRSSRPNADGQYEREIIIRETEDGVIEQFYDGQFYNLYNFNLELGDTIEIFVVQYAEWGFTRTHIPMKVDSIKTVNLDGHLIRAQYMRDLEGFDFNFTGWHYEYLGNTEGYFIPNDILVCEFCPGGVGCFTSEEGGYSIQLTEDGCAELIVDSVSDLPDVSDQLTVFPNPVAGGRALRVNLTAELVRSASELSLYDQTGRVIARRVLGAGITTATITETDLPGGVYHLVWTGDAGRAVKKVVVW